MLRFPIFVIVFTISILSRRAEASRVTLTTYVNSAFNYNNIHYFSGGSEIQLLCSTTTQENGTLALYRNHEKDTEELISAEETEDFHKEIRWTTPPLDKLAVSVRCCFEKSDDNGTIPNPNCSQLQLGGAPIASISKENLPEQPNSTDLSVVSENEPLFLSCSAPYIPKVKVFWRIRGHLMTSGMQSDEDRGHHYNMNTSVLGTEPNEFSCQLFMDDILMSEKKFILTTTEEKKEHSSLLMGALLTLVIVTIFSIVLCCYCCKKPKRAVNRKNEYSLPLRYKPADEEDPYAADSV